MKGLTLKEMQELPAQENSSLLGDCAICLIEFCGKLRLLPCCHWFHENCIFRWLKINSTCPNCRHPLRKFKSMKKYYLNFINKPCHRI